MFRVLRQGINLRNGIALTALVLALGGGYALAFSGSGTLQKGKEVGITSQNETVRTLTGIGKISADCLATDPHTLNVRFTNSSGEPLTLRILELSNEDFDDLTLNSGQTTPQTVGEDTNETLLYEFYPANGSKQPQGDMTVNAKGAVSNSCAAAEVAVLALHTEQ